MFRSETHICFGAFQLDMRAGELRKNGYKVRVPEQSIQVLAMLLERPGDVVTREELHQRLWPNGTIVEFDHSINAAIKRLRQALEDNADAPRYVETLPRRGYRFIFPIESRLTAADGPPTEKVEPDDTASRYRLFEKLGAGGMGVVCRAEDTLLKRTVAIKMISEHFSEDPQMRERFEREAQAIAALNHPHICTLYDLVRQDGSDWLVMEYVAGETLAGRLEKGALPLEQALMYAIQIADALDTAHKQGIIHRDLKPGNLMLTKSGVKLLDFGLVKFRTKAGGDTEETKPLTREQAVLGTMRYMAPEQLEGREADARSDIYSFGAIIHEMAVGERSLETPLVNRNLDLLVRACRAKDPDARWQNAHDIMMQLKWIREADENQSEVRQPSRRKVIALIGGGTAIAAASAFTGYRLRRPSRENRMLRFQILPPPGSRFTPGEYGSNAAISPDGRQLACVVDDGKQMLWLRALDSMGMKSLAHTNNAQLPFWSADGRYVGFFAGGRLKTINISDGAVNDLCRVSIALGGTWNQDGTIVLAAGYQKPLHRIPAGGGDLVPVTELDRRANETMQCAPAFLPDGRNVVFWSWRGGRSYTCLASLESRQTRTLITDGGQAIYADPGLLAVRKENSLVAVPFDSRKLQVTGEPRTLLEYPGFFSMSRNGVLAYLSDESSAPVRPNTSAAVQFSWCGRDGKRTPVGKPIEYGSFALAPDEQRVALDYSGPPPNIWILDLTTGIMSRLTHGDDTTAVWSPDGKQVVYTSRGNGQRVYRKDLATGEEVQLLASAEETWVKSWSRDGTFLVYQCGNGFCRLPLTGDRTPEVLFKAEFDVDGPRPSPDGRWLAYCSSETGRWEVYVAELPGMRQKRQISSSGGAQPQWRSDGKELYYLALNGKVMATEIASGKTFTSGTPNVLFETRIRTTAFVDQYAATRNGQRFLVAEPVSETPDTITVVVNWAAGLDGRGAA